MNDALFNNTKLAAYFLWEYTGCENALNLWYCAEDMACYFEQSNILESSRVHAILRLGVYDQGYIQFVRHVAYRIYVYANDLDAEKNWFAAEHLLNDPEWIRALTAMAALYRHEHSVVINDVRSENVRAFYDEQTFHTS